MPLTEVLNSSAHPGATPSPTLAVVAGGGRVSGAGPLTAGSGCSAERGPPTCQPSGCRGAARGRAERLPADSVGSELECGQRRPEGRQEANHEHRGAFDNHRQSG